MHSMKLLAKLFSLFIAFLLVLASFPAPIASAQGVTDGWTKHDIDTSLSGAGKVYVYDIDSDGNPDVVATGLNDNSVIWYEAPDDPTDSWTGHDIDTSLSGALGVYVHDIDSDGNPDVVATGQLGDNVTWYEAPDDPTGSWTGHDIDTSLIAPSSVYVHDIDSDGNPDVVATGYGGDNVTWYEAPDDPSGSWTAHDIDTSLGYAIEVFVHDIDSDGNPDVVATGLGDSDVVWYEAPDDPTGSWSKHTIDASLDGAYSICVHDIDGDGNPDVAATGAIANDVVWYEAPDDPAGSWTKHDIDTNLSAAYSVYVHDIDGDGNPDALAAGFGVSDVVWYEAPDNPTGSWTRHDIDTNLDGASAVYAHDIDGDGNPDVVAAASSANDVVWYRIEWESYKTGVFPAGEVCNTFSDYATEHIVHMYGTAFKRSPNLTGSWTKRSIDTSLNGARAAYVYDIDGDGDPDVVATGYLGDNVTWYEAPDNPTGSWTGYYIDTGLDGAIGLYVHDIDDDGNPDVVATGYFADNVTWYEAPADPTGSWTEHDIGTGLDGAMGVYVHDIDDDGNPDVVATAYLGDNVTWYKAPADPTGSWTGYDIGTGLNGACGVFVHDIDDDGNPDVVATGNLSDNVTWYEAPDDPTGSWTGHDIDTSLGGACAIYVYDIDDDGNPDVVAAGYSDNDVVWYKAPADPTDSWTKHNIDTDLSGALEVYVYDIDSDGNPDVVATGQAGDNVTWYEAPDDPTGSWAKHDIDTSLDGASGVYVHDIDSDGNPDVIAAGYSDDSIAWYEFPQTDGKDYKVVLWEGTTTKRKTETVTAQDGAISIQHTFIYGTDNQGTWYAGVYPTTYDPATYNASDVNLIWGDTFEVQESAIPEFPTVITAIIAIGLCAGIYLWMRKKAAPVHAQCSKI